VKKSTTKDVQSTTHQVFSIFDIREKEFRGKPLTQEERRALTNFDKYRIRELNSIRDEKTYHIRYRELQVMANLGDYREFLDQKYELE
jgi:hypothetical protein